MRFLGFWGTVLVLVTLGISFLRSHHGARDSVGANSSQSPSGTGDAGIRLKLHKVIDTEGTGKLACTFLLPEGWTSQDSIRWVPNDYMTPVVGSSHMTSDDGEITLDSTSGLETNFSQGPSGDAGQRPPRSVSAYLISEITAAHPDTYYQVVSQEDTPIPVENTSGGMGQMFASHGAVKLSYSKGGQSYTVKIQARLDSFQTNAMPTAVGGSIQEGGWVVSNWFAVSAPENRIDEAMKLAGIVLASVKTDVHFFNAVMQARDVIQRNFYSQEQQIMRTSQIISQTNDEISNAIESSYEAQESAQEKEVTAFDDTIRGIDKYNDDDGKVDLPSGYSHAWSDGNGTYIVSEDHLYDPNVTGPGGTWHELAKSQ